MGFEKTYIEGKKICVVHIDASRIHMCYFSFKNQEIQILHYKEKRLNHGIFEGNICIKKTELLKDILEIHDVFLQKYTSCDEIAFSSFGSSALTRFLEVNYERTSSDPMDISQMKEVFSHAQNVYEAKSRTSLASSSDMKLVFSRIEEIKIDGKNTKALLHTTGNSIKLRMCYSKIPSETLTWYKEVATSLSLQLSTIIPSEYAFASRSFPEKDICILRIQAHTTSVSVKIGGKIIGIRHIEFGSSYLYKKLISQFGDKLLYVMTHIGEEKYFEERKKFFTILTESIELSLEDILGDNLCSPHIHISSKDLPKNCIGELLEELKQSKYFSSQKLESIDAHYTYVMKHIPKIQIHNISHVSPDIYALMEELRQHYILSGDTVSKVLLDFQTESES